MIFPKQRKIQILRKAIDILTDGYQLGILNARMDHHLSSVWWCGAMAGFFLMNILRALV